MSQQQPVQLPYGANPPIAWNGVPGSTDTILFFNPDINNTAYLGYTPQITSTGLNTIPLPPYSSVSLRADRTIYAVAAAGTASLVVIPGGVAFFRGLSTGLGSLSIPSLHSPNFVSGTSGWTINKDGSAQFNNLTIRGNFVGPNFYISDGDGTLSNTPAFLLYSGTPAVGNLIYSNSQNGGLDKFNNSFLGGEMFFNNATLLAQQIGASFTTSPAIQWWSFTAQPNATFTQISALSSGDNIIGSNGFSMVVETTAGGQGLLLLRDLNQNVQDTFFVNAAGVGSLSYQDTNIGGGTRGDNNNYDIGERTAILQSNQTISTNANNLITDGSTGAFSFAVAAGSYHFRARIVYSVAAAVGTPAFHVTGPAVSAHIMIFTLQYNGIASGFARPGTSSPINETFGAVANATANGLPGVAVDIEGCAKMNAAGTLAFGADIGAAGNSPFTIQQGSFLTLRPTHQ